MCCSVLQSVTTQCNILRCSMLQCVAACCSVPSFALLCRLTLTRGEALFTLCRSLCRRLKLLRTPEDDTLQHNATQCNILQHTTSHCNTLQHTTPHCNTLQHTATHCNTLQHTATHCNTLHHIFCTVASASPSKISKKTPLSKHESTKRGDSRPLHIHCNTLQHTAVHCKTLQHTATHYNTLQHTATHCSTLQYREPATH